jgi:predicted metal-dependent phosphoesterase TrpH
LEQALQKALISRENRNEQMARNLAEAGLDISIEQLRNAYDAGTVLTRAHFAGYLYDTKQISSANEAFVKYLNPNGPYYVPRKYIKPKDAIRLIHKAGGIAVLAHPFVYHLPEQELDELIGNLKKDGLDGLEVFYSSNTGFDEGIARRYANKYNLLMTGGSDFHGDNKPHISMGTGRGNLRIPYSVLTNIKNQKSNDI